MIEFRDNEEYCRWNDVLMTPEKNIELFGGDILDDSCILEDGSYIIYEDDAIYVEAKTIIEAIIKYLKSCAFTQSRYSYSNALDEEHGFSNETISHFIKTEIIDNINDIFLLDKSKYNLDLYFQFKQELDKYYDRSQ